MHSTEGDDDESDVAIEYELLAIASENVFWTEDVASGRSQFAGLDAFECDGAGIDRERWNGRVHPEDRERVRRAVSAEDPSYFDDVTGERGRFTIDYRWRASDGSYVDCRELGIVAFDRGDPVTRAGVITLPSHERDRAVERNRAFIEASADCFTHITPDGTMAYVSDPTAMVGRRSTDFLDQPLDAFLHPDDRERALAFFEDLQSGARDGRIEARFEHGDGSWIWIETSGAPIPDTYEMDGVVTVSRDITERKRAEEALERQNERLDEFASIVSHDLRNPLNVATGRLEMVREDYDREHLEHIEAAHDRMRNLVGNLLTLAREGRTVTNVDSVDLGPITRRAWQLVETKGASPDVDVDCAIEADRDRLLRLFENLFRNTIEHAGDGVDVKVVDTPDGFFLTDTGSGIAVDDRERIFETGFSTNRDGTGFGLRIVQEIVEAHDWSIHVSESAEGGARFDVTGVSFVSR